MTEQQLIEQQQEFTAFLQGQVDYLVMSATGADEMDGVLYGDIYREAAEALIGSAFRELDIVLTDYGGLADNPSRKQAREYSIAHREPRE